MCIQTVKLNNFRSFVGDHTWVLPTEPGLYNLTGVNLDNPRLEREGTGKSSLLEAIYWCLYGRSTRGLKGGDVVSWGAKGCSVTVTMPDLVITRTQSPNSLTANGTPTTDEDLQKLLRIGPVAFKYSVILPQFGDSFFDLTPANKLTLFSEILELDYWLEKSKEASAIANEVQDAIRQTQTAIEVCQSTITQAENDLKLLQKQQLEHHIRKTQEIIEIKKQRAEVALLLEKQEKELEDLKNVLGGHKKRKRVFKEPKELEEECLTLAATINQLDISLAKLASLSGKCPTCDQPVNEKQIALESKSLKAQLVAANKQQLKVSKELEKEYQTKEAIDRNCDDFERAVWRAVANRDRLLDAESQLTLELKKVEESDSFLDGMLAKKEKDLAKAKSKLTKVERELNELQSDYDAANFWVAGFKRIRLSLIEETLQQLEIEVNNNLASLGLTDWRIEFDVERENKSGGITKGFVVLIYPPGQDQPKRFEMWSGGETQRLRLAGDIGLANLILERAGVEAKTEFYDEPSKHMGSAGQLDMAETLYQRAVTYGKVIILVDHNTLDFGNFAGVITSTKEGGRSSITVSY